MSQIPPLAPSLVSGYMSSTSHPAHNISAQSRYEIFGIPIPRGGGYNPNQSFNHASFNLPGINTTRVGPSSQPDSTNWGIEGLSGILFLENLNLLYLTKLMNELVAHLPQWRPIPTKLPSNIPKSKGKYGEDPSNHIMTFHLWCCSNSLLDDSFRLRLF